MKWGAHNSYWLEFLWIRKAHSNGAIGMRLKLCGPLSYAYADNFGVVFAYHSSFNCIFVCEIILSHRFSAISTLHI